MRRGVREQKLVRMDTDEKTATKKKKKSQLQQSIDALTRMLGLVLRVDASGKGMQHLTIISRKSPLTLCHAVMEYNI